ncbi:sodium/hydrogen exchanger 9B2-like [Acanthaster planci]|uniref:Sodium/hydrogen exchanger 9B2-like n=1 Tax=Acanthaster planci TaxID=133434 RepID=A0A8B8A462_ACAPL|nr:sodium/hydrogen exchanger 9B2-like [Acanthaster planci]XP_022110707.1 sodium/hydrogen exchanger 9B2-like [Acanthaster planci]XP_022110708.1 sodium/hydrogen exchanger 9B2-like [Acanthaster planci]
MASPARLKPQPKPRASKRSSAAAPAPKNDEYAEPKDTKEEVIYATPGEANVYDIPQRGNMYATPNQSPTSTSPVHSSKPGSPAMEWDGYQTRMSQDSHRWDQTPPEIPPFDLDLEDRDDAGSEDSGEVCSGRCSSCKAILQPCMTQYNPLPDNPTLCGRLKYALLCPPHGRVSRDLTLVLLMCLSWGVVLGVTGNEALPGGTFFALYVLTICCVFGGFLVKLVRLPPLLGMLIVGFLLRNVPRINIAVDIDKEWSSALRSVALVVILLQAGLGLDAKALRSLSMVCLRLCCLPCLVEACVAGVVSHFLLGFPWTWGFMLGFVLGAVTPAVIVPSLLSLQSRGYGVAKGIPTLVIAAASCDDILAISAFGVILGAAFATGDLVYNILRGPLELVVGVAFGCLAGVVLWYLPDRYQKSFVMRRTFLLFGGGLFVIFGSAAVKFSGAGPLGCLTMAFVAGYGWRKSKEPVVKNIDFLWVIFEPLLFGLIGAEVAVETVQPATIGLGLATLFIGLVARLVASFLAVFRAKMNLKEKIFIALAWLPKATVQAAIGPVALDTAIKQGAGKEYEELGTQLLTVAVLSILVTAPLGAIAIALAGPRLLSKSVNEVPRDNNNRRPIIHLVGTPPESEVVELSPVSPEPDHSNLLDRGAKAARNDESV